MDKVWGCGEKIYFPPFLILYSICFVFSFLILFSIFFKKNLLLIKHIDIGFWDLGFRI